jgi:kumamolisin
MKRIALALLSAMLIAGCASHGSAPLVPVAAPQNAQLQPSSLESAPLPPGAAHFVVTLPLRNEAELDRVLGAISDPQSPQYRQFLSPQAFAQRYAPLPAALNVVASDLRAAGFSVDVLDQAVSATGTQSQAERYFRTTFNRASDGVFQPRTALAYPHALTQANAVVIGLNGEPLLHIFSHRGPTTNAMHPDNKVSPRGPYFPVELKQAYQMPSIQETSGEGVTIGIVMSSPIIASDMQVFFEKYLLLPVPLITTVKIHGGGKIDLNGATGEASLDVQQSGGIAPGAHIVLYDIPDLSNANIYLGYAAAVKAGATIVNSSFGGCERSFFEPGGGGQAELNRFEAIFKAGMAKGTTWVASSGDFGADMCGNDNVRGVSWPADSPSVVAVGGTNLITSHSTKTDNSTYVRESAFHDSNVLENGATYWGSGGGYSTVFTRPAWQAGFVSQSGRGVPDVALHMGGLGFSTGATSGSDCAAQKCSKDDSSDWEEVGGGYGPVIGTSASSPDMAGLLALGAQIAGKPLGDVHPLLYALAKKSGLFRTDIPGNNGLPAAKGRWDPVLGLGTPIAAYKIIGAKTKAGVPGSSTNP